MGGVLILLTLSVLIGFILGGRFSWLGIGAVGIALALLAAAVLHRQGFGALSGIAIIVACLTVNQVSYFVGWLGRVDKPDPDANTCQQHESRKALDELVIPGGDAA